MFYPFDPLYFIILAPGLLLAVHASIQVKSTFARAREIPSRRGWTGAEIAQAILNAEGIRDVGIEAVQGHLSDHYDPRRKVLRLSPDVYRG
jgi:Zn-dependent membrane protease YugP